MINRTLITVLTEPAGNQKDLELPSDMPLERVGKLIIKGLDDDMGLLFENGRMAFHHSTGDGQWSLLDGTQTLKDASVLDGSFLRIIRAVV